MSKFDIDAYHDVGFASVPRGLSSIEVDEINDRLDDYLANHQYGLVAEEDGAAPRAVHGLHLVDPFFRALAERPLFLDPVEAILKCPVYVHQFKINLKVAHIGESWPWHQDFIFWEALDGIARPDLVNVAIYLSDADELSGPLDYFPGSHSWGNVCRRTSALDSAEGGEGQNDWSSNVGRDLTFQVPSSEVRRRANGLAPVTAMRAAGDVDFFHPQLVHGSKANTSSHDRRLLIVTYNAADNLPQVSEDRARPEFLCSRSFAPIRTYKIYSGGDHQNEEA